MKNHKILAAAWLLATCGAMHAQDRITKHDGTAIQAKVTAVALDKIEYKLFSEPNGPDYAISKDEVAEIKFASGRTEVFAKAGTTLPEAPVSLEQTQKFILETLNTYGHDPGSDNRRYRASFQDDHLFLAIYKRNGKVYDEGQVYDLSSTAKFHVDRRSNNLAYLNVHVPLLVNPKKNKWDRIKLVLALDNSAKAESLETALQHYKTILQQKRKGDSPF